MPAWPWAGRSGGSPGVSRCPDEAQATLQSSRQGWWQWELNEIVGTSDGGAARCPTCDGVSRTWNASGRTTCRPSTICSGRSAICVGGPKAPSDTTDPVKYQGSQARIAAKLALLLLIMSDLTGIREVEDRFCGSCRVAMACHELGLTVAALHDGNEALVVCLKAVANGWSPPRTMSAARYEALRREADHRNPEYGFAMGFCSFGGRWARGLAGEDERWKGATARHAAAKAHAELLRMRPMLSAAEIVHGDCLAPTSRIAFADPPWVGTAPFPGAPAFDAPSAWARLRSMNAILACEGQLMSGWSAVAEFTRTNRGLRKTLTTVVQGPDDELTRLVADLYAGRSLRLIGG